MLGIWRGSRKILCADMTINNWVNSAYHYRIISQKELPQKDSLVKVPIFLLPLIPLKIQLLGGPEKLEVQFNIFYSLPLFTHSFPTALKCMTWHAVSSLPFMLNPKI